MGVTAHQPNWPIDAACGTLSLGGRLSEARLRASRVEEDFQAHTPAREFVPLTVQQGRRTVILAHAYTADTDLMPLNQRQPRIGDGEVYYYQADAIALLWRCNLIERHRAADPVTDDNLHRLWDAFESLLRQQFPDMRQMLTPTWNRPYDQARWEAFVRQRGFTRPSPAGLRGAALIKDLPATA